MHSKIEVITAATSQDLTVLATAKAHLGITGTAMDSKVADWISQSSAAISSSCDRVLAKETVRQTIYLDSEVPSIVLRRYPVDVISSVTVDGTALGATDYDFDPESGVLFRISSDTKVAWSGSKVMVQYSAGYELLPELPPDLERACLELLSYCYSASGRDPLAKRIEIPDVQTVDYWIGAIGRTERLPPSVMALIAPYKSLKI